METYDPSSSGSPALFAALFGMIMIPGNYYMDYCGSWHVESV
jgi:hypothetical protein